MNSRAWLWIVLGIAVGGACTGLAVADDGAPGTAAPADAPASTAGDRVATPTAPAKTDAPFALPGATVAIVPIRGPINNVTYRSVKLRVGKARAAGAGVIVLEMDTPGGLVISALHICTFLKNMSEPVLAWVHPDAYSAGAMISLATDGVVMSSRSKIGDCAPIMLSPGGGGLQSMPDTERAKIQSPILEEFRDSARRNGYDLTLCEAMVRVGPAIYMIRRRDDPAKIKYVRADELDDYQLSDNDQPSPGNQRGIAGLFKIKPASDWQIVEKVLDKNQLLTLSQDEAIKYGFARRIVSNERQLTAFLGTTPDKLLRFEPNWSEMLAVFLTLPLVQGALSLFFLMGVYMEMKTPGLGVGAIVAVSSLIVLLGAPYLTGLAEVWEIVLILVGVVLLALEIFVIPGFGIAGLSGMALVFCGMLLMFVQTEPGHPGILPTLPGTWWQLRVGAATLIGTMLVAVVLFYFLSKYYGSIPLLKRLVLVERHERPAVAAAAAGTESHIESTAGRVELKVGQTGRTLSKLRPSGRVDINGYIVDGLTTGAWVDVDCPVKVIEVQGCRVVVEEL